MTKGRHTFRGSDTVSSSVCKQMSEIALTAAVTLQVAATSAAGVFGGGGLLVEVQLI